jgi:hypothetical protein
MRKPIALTPDKMKRRTGSDHPVVPGQPARQTPSVTPTQRTTPAVQAGVVTERAANTGSAPVRLTKRKSGKHPTLPLGVVPVVHDDEPPK